MVLMAYKGTRQKGVAFSAGSLCGCLFPFWPQERFFINLCQLLLSGLVSATSIQTAP